MDDLSDIFDSLLNGNRRQMADQIDEYGLYDFWADMAQWLEEVYTSGALTMKAYTDMVVSYHRIRNR